MPETVPQAQDPANLTVPSLPHDQSPSREEVSLTASRNARLYVAQRRFSSSDAILGYADHNEPVLIADITTVTKCQALICFYLSFQVDQIMQFSSRNFFSPQIIEEPVQLTRYSCFSLIPPPFEPY
jgi:hypothetical protein